MNYDKYPEIKINGFDHDVFKDKYAIIEKISQYKEQSHFCLTVECYPGVYDEIYDLIYEAYQPDVVIRSEDIFYDKETLNHMMQPHLTDDRVRGVMYYGNMEDFVDQKELSKKKDLLSAPQKY